MSFTYIRIRCNLVKEYKLVSIQIWFIVELRDVKITKKKKEVKTKLTLRDEGSESEED